MLDEISQFDPLKVAQDILDRDLVIVWKDETLGVHREDELQFYSAAESKAVVNEFHDMFQIAQRCTLLCDPLRKKLERVLFVCTSLS